MTTTITEPAGITTPNEVTTPVDEWIDVRRWYDQIRFATMFAPWWRLNRVVLPTLALRLARELALRLDLTEMDCPKIDGEPYLILHDGLTAITNEWIEEDGSTKKYVLPASESHRSDLFRADKIILCTLQLNHGQLRKQAAEKQRASLLVKMATMGKTRPEDRDVWEKAVRAERERQERAMENDPVMARLKMAEQRIRELQSQNVRLMAGEPI